MSGITEQIADEVGARGAQVQAAIDLLDGGATVPFIARYRKEATGGLDDTQLRQVETRLIYLRDLQARRDVVRRSIEEQGKLTPALGAAIDAAQTKQALEDLYLPYRVKRRTKGQIAREAGLEPLADSLLQDPRRDPLREAQAFILSGEGELAQAFGTVPAVLDGVRDLLAERWADDATLLQALRAWSWSTCLLLSRKVEGQNEQSAEVAKFRDYFDFEEPIARVPSHRALAVLRGRAQDVLSVKLVWPEPEPGAAFAAPSADASGRPATASSTVLAEGRIAAHIGWSYQGRAADELIRRSVAWAWRVKLSLGLERDLLTRLREDAEAVAMQVFARNLRDVLLAAPAGPRPVMGLDPGLRTGVKVAVLDGTGKLLATDTVYPHEPRRDWSGALASLRRLCLAHGVELVAIGNGTASRETDKLAAELVRLLASDARAVQRVVVSEAGASVYSASELASQEMPDIDVSLRGAVSIARRLQDPLAELVKIDPKAIGVGQYQHDVNQAELARTLDAVVEDCVNRVGVDLNTASVPLLSRVAGLGPGVARSVVRWREAHGRFASRQQLLEVSGLGPRTFEQCAGFLRIRGGSQALDMTGVHPETYPVVERILRQAARPIESLMGQAGLLRTFTPEQFADERFGVVTVRDILIELEKPGRDPRPAFEAARLQDGVESIADLRPGMVLEGTVTNVAAFGAFVDVGVHQDGLVHLSQMSQRFVKDPHEVVQAGQVVRVQVLEVDLPRQRIALSLRIGEAAQSGRAAAADGARPAAVRPGARAHSSPGQGGRDRAGTASAPGASAMAAAFARLRPPRD